MIIIAVYKNVSMCTQCIYYASSYQLSIVVPPSTSAGLPQVGRGGGGGGQQLIYSCIIPVEPAK